MILIPIPASVLLRQRIFNVSQLVNTVETDALEIKNTSRIERLKTIKSLLSSNNILLQDLCSIEHELLGFSPNKMIASLYEDGKYKYIQALPFEAKVKITSLESIQPVKDCNGNVNAENYRVNLMMVNKWLQEYYFFINERELFIHNLKSNFTAMLSLLFLVTLSSVLYYSFFKSGVNFFPPFKIGEDGSYSLLIGMACGGYLGAVISTVQRMQKMSELPIDGIDRQNMLLKMHQGKKGIYLSLVFGTLAPFMVYLLIYVMPGGKEFTMFGVNLIPEFFKYEHLYMTNILEAFKIKGMLTITDVSKMLFISLLSGFSERLIPDVLDRLSKEINSKFSASTK